MLIRILTQDKHRKWLLQTVAEYFPNFTVYKTLGWWRGGKERSLVIEVDTAGQSWMTQAIVTTKVKNLCFKIKGYNKQESVLVQRVDVDSEFY